MVKPVQRNEILGFSKGMVTELNPLAGQIDTTSSEANFELHPDGTRSRRLGFDIESRGSLIPTGIPWTTLAPSRASSFLWQGAGGNPENKFVVVQIGQHLLFFKVGGGPYGQTALVGRVLLPFSEGVVLSFGAVEGFLGITNGTPNIGLVEYNHTNTSFTYSSFRLKIRDQFGIQETIEPRYETEKQFRGALNWQHYYNLFNQGWAIPRKDWVTGVNPPVDAVLLGSGKQPMVRSPGNADQVWTGIDRKPISETSSESFEAFHYAQFEGMLGADTRAAKGYFIIDAFDRGTARFDAWNRHRNIYPTTGNLAPSPQHIRDLTSGGPTSIAAHAGRLFYSGCRGVVDTPDARSPNYNNHVFFTRLIQGKVDFDKCYQEGDPTSQESSDVVDTDGGFFTVSDAINIHTMYSVGDRLILIAENGVWAVTGGSGYGFAATNYKVEKQSTYGGVPNKSFVEFGGAGYFWGWDGIYIIQKDQYGDYKVENLTSGLVDTFYNNIADTAKITCQGFVDRVRKQIRWVYTEGDLFTDAVTKELIIDLKFQALYPFTITPQPSNTAYPLAGVQLGDYSLRLFEADVFVEEEEVLSDEDVVQSYNETQTALDSTVKYATCIRVGTELYVAFCEYGNLAFEDWAFLNTPVDAAAYMETNAFTGGDFGIKKQVPYVVMAFAETEKVLNGDEVSTVSSCMGSFRWDFTHMARSGKWGTPQQLYRKNRYYFGDVDIDNGYTINVTKTKVRGSGRAFALRVETEPKKDCHIYGWNLSLTGNGMV